jgi:hypothetical protein
MNTYDKIALSNKPSLYLSAPEITDKSGTGLFPLSNNNLSATGQPIVYGNDSSYVVGSGTTVDITGNPLFFNDRATFECVLVASRPTEQVSIVIDDDNQNTLAIDPEGITIKLFFESLLSTYAQTATVPIKDWNKKLYIVLTITETQATLSVNGESQIINYTDNIVSSTNVVIGGGYSGYTYLMDGIGFYNNTISNKANLINDPLNGHANHAASKHAGRTTKFDGYMNGKIHTFGLSDFLYSENVHTLIYYSPTLQEGLDYLIVRTNDERVIVSYDINLDDAGEFTEYLLVGTVTDATLRFMVSEIDIDSDFTITIQPIISGDIVDETPANMVLAGLALFGESDESIVNLLDGTKLTEATYAGTWIYSDIMPDTPKSVEIVFKPIESDNDTIVFSSSDGSASFGTTGAITNFTAYLNGQLVTDLTDIRYDQWNHLVLIDSAPTADTFYLNSDDGVDSDETISYLFMTAYPDELSGPDVTILYDIVNGTDLLDISESVSVSEGTFSGGTAFNAYSYPWAIVGAGGL